MKNDGRLESLEGFLGAVLGLISAIRNLDPMFFTLLEPEMRMLGQLLRALKRRVLLMLNDEEAWG